MWQRAAGWSVDGRLRTWNCGVIRARGSGLAPLMLCDDDSLGASKRQRLFLFRALVAVLVCWSAGVAAGTYDTVGLPVARVFGMEAHGGDHEIWALTQLENGLLYGATNSGIVEWDGARWRDYDNPNRGRTKALTPWRDGRLYAGSTNDIGYFAPDAVGQLAYTSLLADWTFEQRQIGEVWSSAANSAGVLFSTSQAVYFWTGDRLLAAPGLPRLGSHRFFSVDNAFYFKAEGEEFVHRLDFSGESAPRFKTEALGWSLPEEATLIHLDRLADGSLLAVTARHGVFRDGVLAVASEALLEDATLQSAYRATDGFLYLGSLQHGLFILTPDLRPARQYQEQHGLGMNAVYAVFEDRQHNIWLAGSPSIVKMQPPHLSSVFQLGGSSISAERLLLIDEDLYVTGHGLYRLLPSPSAAQPASFVNLLEDEGYVNSLARFEDHLVVTRSDGLYAREEDDASAPFVRILAIREPNTLRQDPVSGQLWVSSEQGLGLVRRARDRWQVEWIEGTEDLLDFMEVEDNGTVWIGTRTQELYRVENSSGGLDAYSVTRFGESDGLGPVNVLPFMTNDGVRFGTTNGLMLYRSGAEPPLQYDREMPEYFRTAGNDVFRFIEDPFAVDGRRVWYQVGDDVGFVEQRDGAWDNHPTGLINYPFVSYRDFQSTDPETIWISLISGQVYRVNVDYLRRPPAAAALNIRETVDTRKNAVLHGGAPGVPFPHLDQRNNSLEIQFALADSAANFPPEYRTRLLGSRDESWSPWSPKDSVVYTQLGGSDYRLELEARDIWGRVSSASLPFSVTPPWYLSPLALLSYVLVSVVALILSAWVGQRWRNRQLEARNLQLEQTVALRTQEVSAKVEELRQQQILKDRFFGNVSHEFRTPLTLTIGPLETALQEHGKGTPPVVSELVAMALNNARRMLTLVGQILDVNRLEAGKLPVRVSRYDVAQLMHRVAEQCRLWAEENEQQVAVVDCDDPRFLYLDLDLIEKALLNLLSNAIKYSGAGSTISLRIVASDDRVGLIVDDNGVGIDETLQERIFERYFQSTASETLRNPGTGIGLSLVNEIADLHHGTVALASRPGSGAQFTLWLQTGKGHFSDAEFVEPVALSPVSPEKSSHGDVIALGGDQREGDDRTTLLVVDDNAELRQFISLTLSANYRVVTAVNGEEGFKRALETLPDLVVSDVMMPVMDGLDMTARLKQHPATQCIPVILLTAKTTKRETVEGFSHGADDYLTKPFDTSELIMRIEAQIAARKLVRERILSEQALAAAQIDTENRFRGKLQRAVMDHLGDPAFNVERLAQAMHMSRDTLTRRCKKELEQTPLAYLNQVKMSNAERLLTDSSLSISEIAYGLGFESLAYFSRSFKKHSGLSPSEFAASRRLEPG